MDIQDTCKVRVPEGKSGAWAVERFSISDEEAAMYNINCRGRAVFPGSYTRLTRNGSIVMSDTQQEVRDHMSIISSARGHVLIAGLGLGMVVNAVLSRKTNRPWQKPVTRVTVVEKSPDVIRLVEPHYSALYGDRLEVVEADIFVWKPPKGAEYGAAWMDIWDDIMESNLEQMATLKRRFSRRSEWIGCWAEAACRRQRREW